MAKKSSRYGRTLIVFVLATLAMYGGLALNGNWTPKLGLDLQGGTRITLEASTEAGEDPTTANLQEARGIIDQRVNGSGVAESEVGTQGDNQIVVEIPGENRSDLVDAVKATAQLRFRLVAAVGSGSLPVLGTPRLLAWLEAVTCACAGIVSAASAARVAAAATVIGRMRTSH